MTAREARETMMEFVNRNRGKTVLFASLSEADKLAYVMVKTFNYYTFLKGRERIERVIENALAHRKSNYEVYTRFPTECMRIANE